LAKGPPGIHGGPFRFLSGHDAAARFRSRLLLQTSAQDLTLCELTVFNGCAKETLSSWLFRVLAWWLQFLLHSLQ